MTSTLTAIQCAMAAATTVRHGGPPRPMAELRGVPLSRALREVSKACLSNSLTKLLSYHALELAMTGPAEKRDRTALKVHDTVSSCLLQAVGVDLSLAEAACWLRQWGAAKLSNRFLAAVRRRICSAHPEFALAGGIRKFRERALWTFGRTRR